MAAQWASLALVSAVLLAAGAGLAGAQTSAIMQPTESYNAQNAFSAAGTIYNRTGTLTPLHFNLYGIPVPSEYSNPDILLTLNATSGGTGLNMYCNPGYGAFVDPNGNYPGPDYSVWSSQLATPVNQIFISKNDPYYSQTGGRTSNATAPYFICSVINNDANTTTNYTLVASIISDNRTLAASEQALLGGLFQRCCSAAGACNAWKAQNSGFVSANGGAVDTDFCSFPNQICDPNGNLYRLNLDGYNLSCAWPGDLLGQFSRLTTLSLSANPHLTGNTTAVFGTVGNLTDLHFLDLSGDVGLSGTIDSGAAGADLCMSAQGNLVSLVLNSMGLTGNIPACLYSQGSSLITLDLGNNNFTGQLRNTIPANSSLQLFHVDYNQLSGNIPASLVNARVLVDFDATANALTGTIPPALGTIPTLESFVVKQNNLSGPIPDSFGTANNLQMFDVKQNRLTTLPAAWTDASHNAANSSYVNIRASFNNISAPFPAGLVTAPQLTYLILNVNNLTGPLPSNASMFPSLRALNVSYNHLTGSIPPQFNTSALFSATPVYLSTGAILQQVFDLSYNRLAGALPAFLNQSAVPLWTRSGIFLGGNNLTANCSNPGYSYLTSICPTGSAAASGAPANAPPPPPQALVYQTPPSSAAVKGAPVPNFAPANVRAAGATASGSAKSGGGGGLSGGAIAGIVIGVLAALALAGALAWLLVARRRRSPAAPRQANGGTFSMPGFGDGEFGRKSSLGKSLAGARSSGFERFQDEQNHVELSPHK